MTRKGGGRLWLGTGGGEAVRTRWLPHGGEMTGRARRRYLAERGALVSGMEGTQRRVGQAKEFERGLDALQGQQAAMLEFIKG